METKNLEKKYKRFLISGYVFFGIGIALILIYTLYPFQALLGVLLILIAAAPFFTGVGLLGHSGWIRKRMKKLDLLVRKAPTEEQLLESQKRTGINFVVIASVLILAGTLVLIYIFIPIMWIPTLFLLGVLYFLGAYLFCSGVILWNRSVGKKRE